jgi:hypothetical protein
MADPDRRWLSNEPCMTIEVHDDRWDPPNKDDYLGRLMMSRLRADQPSKTQQTQDAERVSEDKVMEARAEMDHARRELWALENLAREIEGRNPRNVSVAFSGNGEDYASKLGRMNQTTVRLDTLMGDGISDLLDVQLEQQRAYVRESTAKYAQAMRDRADAAMAHSTALTQPEGENVA